ncbi:MAG: tRNA (adenosine(37)-N6)-dimethylallyltransferase MiaA, partial [Actinobacteria bacterium]
TGAKIKKSKQANYHYRTQKHLQVLAIVGPTASKKSELSLKLAEKFKAEIISADSMQVYRGMDIGTSKVSAEIRRKVKHHLIDIISVNDSFNAFEFQKLSRQAIRNINEKQKLPILVGGTGLYVRSALYKLKLPDENNNKEIREKLERELEHKGLSSLQKKLKQKDKQAFSVIDIQNPRRVVRALEIIIKTRKPYLEYRQDWNSWQPIFNSIIIGLTASREFLYKRINERVDSMMKASLLAEVKQLIKEGFLQVKVAKQALGYKELIDHINGFLSLEEAIVLVKKRTRNFAKRQLTWFKKDPNIEWLDIEKEPIDDIIEKVIILLKRFGQMYNID